MTDSYTQLFVHLVFGTKDQQPYIDPEFERNFWDYIALIAEENKMNVQAVGGTSNHIHILLSIPSTCPISRAVQLLKSHSSKWLNNTYFKDRKFHWQKGYGAFSVGISSVPATIKYIRHQKEHHKHRDFPKEYLLFLEKHGIKVNPEKFTGS